MRTQQNPSLEKACNGSLRIFRDLRHLQFSKLLDVYSESLYSACHSNQKRLDAEQDFYAYLRVFFQSGFYAVWEEDDRYISALRLEPYQGGLLLEAVETAPDFRKQGFAKKLLNAVLEYIREKETFPVYSHVAKDNLPSLGLHKACGFTRIAEFAVYIDGSVRQNSCTFVLDK